MFDKKIGSTHIDGSLLHAIDVFENAFMPWPIFMPHGCLARHDGFNWAATFQPWILWDPQDPCRQAQLVSIGPRLFSHGYFKSNARITFCASRFNWATTFQPWIQPPFFGLYCYRKKADFRTYRQLLWILSESRSLFKTFIDMCWPFAHLPGFWIPPRCAKFVRKTVIILPIRLVEWPCTNRVPALQIPAFY